MRRLLKAVHKTGIIRRIAEDRRVYLRRKKTTENSPVFTGLTPPKTNLFEILHVKFGRAENVF